jgi:hypothetical protein
MKPMFTERCDMSTRNRYRHHMAIIGSDTARKFREPARDSASIYPKTKVISERDRTNS